MPSTSTPGPVPSTMRAVVITHHGGPDAIELREVATPRPGDGEVLVRVGAAGCNNTDLWTREGSYAATAEDPDARGGWLGPLDFPRVQGADVAGTVVALGPGVGDTTADDSADGDSADGDSADGGLLGARVLVDPALTYDGDGQDARPAAVLGSEADGGFAEYVVVPSARVHRVDDAPLSDVELAALPIAYGTALGMLERGGVRGGHTVLVTGASGGVGLAAVQLAVARGARVVAVCSGSKAGAVRAAGADAIVDRRDGDVVDQAAAAAPDGYDAAVDVVAGPDLVRALTLLRAGGRWVVAGALAGHTVELDVRRLYLANVALVGSTMHTPQIFGRLVEIARSGAVRPVVAATFGLDDVARAQAELATREHVGKLVVVP